jgi:ubiquinone/menaquinone biosynthesis C-methylase UbiE
LASGLGRYDHGWLGRLHHAIVARTVEVVVSAQPHPRRILEVGCGTGYLLRSLASRCPGAVELAGLDPAAPMIDAARASAADPRIAFAVGFAEQLPYTDYRFDVVVSTTSFDHWADQRAGVAECARTLAADGRLIVADLFSPWADPDARRQPKGQGARKGACSPTTHWRGAVRGRLA